MGKGAVWAKALCGRRRCVGKGAVWARALCGQGGIKCQNYYNKKTDPQNYNSELFQNKQTDPQNYISELFMKRSKKKQKSMPSARGIIQN